MTVTRRDKFKVILLKQKEIRREFLSLLVYPPYISLELLNARSTAALSIGRPLLDAGETTGGDSVALARSTHGFTFGWTARWPLDLIQGINFR